MLRPPGGGTGLELSSFVRPPHEPGSPAAMANELGLRNVAFEVDDLQATVDRLAADGYGLIGGIGRYERTWRMAYVRGRRGSSWPWPSGSGDPLSAPHVCYARSKLEQQLRGHRRPVGADRRPRRSPVRGSRGSGPS